MRNQGTINRSLQRQPYSRREWFVIALGLIIATTGLAILLVAQPKAPSSLFLLAEVLINVPCIAYGVLAYKRFNPR